MYGVPGLKIMVLVIGWSVQLSARETPSGAWMLMAAFGLSLPPSHTQFIFVMAEAVYGIEQMLAKTVISM